MKYIFFVQGEGLGHTTQSIALRSVLEKNGHSIEAVFLGKNFFSAENTLYSAVRHEHFYSPVFLSRTDRKGINLFLTFVFNMLMAPVYIVEILRVAYRVRTSEADRIIVFYDLVGQLGAFFSFSGKPVYSISHHFFFEHPSFSWPKKRKSGRFLLKLHSKLASVGARSKLALSFSSEENFPDKKIIVLPPLLRIEILNTKPSNGEHIHVYLLQKGFLNSVFRLAKLHPEKEFRVFVNQQDLYSSPSSNVQVYSISGNEFRESLSGAGLVICTAGFETLCEAVYFNKPLIVVPSLGHFEQYCNAIDAERVSAAVLTEDIDLIKIPDRGTNAAHEIFIDWIQCSEEMIIKSITV